MRTGFLSDEQIRLDHPAFFPQLFHVHEASKPKGRKFTRVIKKPLLPYYDLYDIAQRTMENPYEGAAEIVKNYTPVMALPVLPPAAPASPATEVNATSEADSDSELSSEAPESPPIPPSMQSAYQELQRAPTPASRIAALRIARSETRSPPPMPSRPELGTPSYRLRTDPKPNVIFSPP